MLLAAAAGEFLEMIKRQIPLETISRISLSTRQDDFVVLHVDSDYDTPLELVFKTEFLTVLDEKYRILTSRSLTVNFSDRIDFRVRCMRAHARVSMHVRKPLTPVLCAGEEGRLWWWRFADVGV